MYATITARRFDTRQARDRALAALDTLLEPPNPGGAVVAAASALSSAWPRAGPTLPAPGR